MKIIFRLWLKLLKVWWQFVVPIRLRILGVNLGKNVQFYGMPIVSMADNSRILIGDRVVLCSDSRFTALGVNHPVVLRTISPGAEIIIGNDCGISGGSCCAALRIELGNECMLGANVTIIDTDFHPLKPIGRRYNANPLDIGTAPVQIEENVFIGENSVILKGVCIGQNSVIGAGSVASKNVAANSIAAGNPAIIRRELQ